ncbi:MAG: right-handed parallel beta-helix repeat-containing protein [Rubrobacter sp.]
MRRTIVLLSTMALTLLVASGVALAAGIGSAGAQSSVVGPGESIQKAINAADPGDTIVVKGVHREDVVIRKNGIKLRGDDAVIEAPTRANADSPCPAICVLGDANLETGELTGPRVSDVSVSGFTIRGFKDKAAFLIDVLGARNTTVVGNRVTGNVANGMAFGRSVNTTIANNHVIGGPETAEKGILLGGFNSHTKIVNNVVRSYNFGVDANQSTNTTIAGNDLSGHSFAAILINDSPGTKIVSNDMSRSGVVGTVVLGQKAANAKLVGNNISGGPFGIYVTDAHGGSFAGNTIHDNCAGMFFEAFPSEPVGDFEVKGNTVENNTRSCRAAQSNNDRNFSGIGIALLGARDMEVTANHLSGNVPSGPTAVSGGVVVSTDPFYGGTIKPRNNSVIGNHFGRNKPDIFYDESGSGNRFIGNLCNTSVPSRLCN